MNDLMAGGIPFSNGAGENIFQTMEGVCNMFSTLFIFFASLPHVLQSSLLYFTDTVILAFKKFSSPACVWDQENGTARR